VIGVSEMVSMLKKFNEYLIALDNKDNAELSIKDTLFCGILSILFMCAFVSFICLVFVLSIE
jgi:hypothetical protein